MEHTSSRFPVCPSPLGPCRDLSQGGPGHRRGPYHSYPCVSSCTFSIVWQVLNYVSYSSISDFSTMNHSQFPTSGLEPLLTQGFSWSSLSCICSLGYKSQRLSHVTIKSRPTSTSVGHSETAQHVSAITADAGTGKQEAHERPQQASLLLRWCCGPELRCCPDWLDSGVSGCCCCTWWLIDFVVIATTSHGLSEGWPHTLHPQGSWSFLNMWWVNEIWLCYSNTAIFFFIEQMQDWERFSFIFFHY